MTLHSSPATATGPRDPGAGDVPPRAVAPYDFRRPIQLSREHARLLQVAFDGFARQSATVFTSLLRRVCTVRLDGLEQRSYAEYVDSREAMTYLTVFTAEPMDGQALLELPLPLVMNCLDHMLGGPGSDQQPHRPLTEIESAVVHRLTDRLLQELQSALEGTVPMRPQRVGVEYSPQLAQAGSPADVVVALTLTLVLGTAEHQMTLCLPYHGLLPHLVVAAAPAPVSERERTHRAASAALLHTQFQALPIEVTARFRPTRIHPVDLDDLAVGDVVRLSHPAVAPLEISANGTTFAYATAGTQGARLAALVVNTPKELS